MKKKEAITYRQLMDKLKQVTPEPEHSEELTASILAAIREQPEQKPKSKLQLVIAWACGAAAIFLAGLFCLDVYLTPDYRPEDTAFILPVSYTSACREETRDNLVRCFIRERSDRSLQKEFLFRNIQK
ncbi:MAG: hypothetical protein LUH10_15320 [Tannerellaceae bacterium]|nr:hypothetical protein [Tannerellaceae bacterium]